MKCIDYAEITTQIGTNSLINFTNDLDSTYTVVIPLMKLQNLCISHISCMVARVTHNFK